MKTVSWVLFILGLIFVIAGISIVAVKSTEFHFLGMIVMVIGGIMVVLAKATDSHKNGQPPWSKWRGIW